jgi:hypothetical protein
MSVITMPRRLEPTQTPRVRTAPARHRTTRATRRRWRERSTTFKVSLIVASTVIVLLAGSSYAAQRQVQIHQLQMNLLQDQARYAAQVSALTNEAAPARVAIQAGHLHLVVPSSVTQIPAVSLNAPLPLPQLQGAYSVSSRTYR